MTDTKKLAPTSFSLSPSLPPTVRQQSKLTKKQKKASAFRAKSSRSKTKNIIGSKHEQEAEMEDLHVLNMEKPSRSRYASGSVQMGNEEGQATEGTERSESTRASRKESVYGTRLAQQEISSQSRQQKSHPKRQRIDAAEAEQHDREQEEKHIKKRKRANLDAVDEKLGMDGNLEAGNAQEKSRNKKQKTEEAERGVDCPEGEGEEMNEGEGGEERKEKKEKQRFILFIG